MTAAATVTTAAAMATPSAVTLVVISSQQGSRTGPTPGIASARARASRAAALVSASGKIYRSRENDQLS